MRAATRARNQRRGVDLSRARTRTRNQAEVLLSQAELWLDASKSDFSTGKMTNRGTGGSALDAQFGSTSGADTNDPLLLAHTGTNYLYLPGVAGNYASSPDSAVLDITGNLSMVADVAADDWTPAATSRLGGKDGAYILNINTTGNLVFTFVDAGSVVRTATSSVALGFTDGVDRKQIGVSYVAGTGVNDVRFWTRNTSSDAWVQLGTTQSSAGTSILASTNVAAVGATDTGASPFAGKVYRFTIYGSVGASNEPASTSPVFDPDFTRGITSGGQTTFTESSSNAATVTINRATSGRKSVAVVRPVLLFGTDDYLEVADNALLDFDTGQDLSLVAVVRSFGTGTSFRLMDKYAIGGPGYRLYQDSVTNRPTMQVSDGTNIPNAAAVAALNTGTIKVAAGVRTGGNVISYNNATTFSTADTTTGTLSNAGPLRIGALGGGGAATAFFNGEVLAIAVFRSALTAADVANIASYYGAS